MGKSVLLLHGLSDTQAIFTRMAADLSQQGYTIFSLDLKPANASLGLEVLADQVAHYVANQLPADISFNLVGFSMGGIVGRYYVQRLGGIERVQRLITVASPHQGTLSAYTSPHLGSVQMRPNSSFLKALNDDIALLEQLNFTSIWTPLDLMILPAHSSQIAIGKNVQIPILTHTGMVTHPAGIRAVATALAEPLRKVPSDRQSGQTPAAQK
jgi:triacylglycerol lipase